MDLHKRVIVLITLAVVFSLGAAALSPDVVQAEGDVPEEPELVEPPAAEETLSPESGVPDAVQALAESGSVLVQVGAGVPLASQAALQVLCKPDPWFYGACLGGKCPYETIPLALAGWVSNAGTGFIYVESNYSSLVTENLPISGVTYPTLKGIVWDTTTAGTKPILVGWLDVFYFPAGFTLQGLDIRYHGLGEPMRLYDNKGLFRMIDVDITTTNPSSAGFQMWNNGPVELLRVNAGGGGGQGVNIDTCDWNGSACTYFGSVKITNSSFNISQDKFGLKVEANGSVTLTGVSASYNVGNGAVIQSTGPVLIKNSVFSGNRTSDLNEGFGLYINPGTKGSVTLENVVLTKNSNHGAFIYTSGNVTLRNVTASLNKKGIMIAATTTEGSGAGAMNVSVLNGVFHDNSGTSLWVEAKGTITLTNIFSSRPDHYGLNLNNTFAVAAPGVTLKNVTLLSNGVGGGVVKSKGSIIIDSINVRSSPLAYGLDLDNHSGPGSVTINGTLFTNVFSFAKDAGLRIKTTRNVLLNNVLAENNGRCGIEIWAGPNTGSVTLKNVNANVNGEWGVLVETTGAISWIGGGANKNGPINDSGGGYLVNVAALDTAPKPVTVSNVVFNGNKGNVGLFVASRGSITLINLQADSNAWDGIKVYKLPGAGTIKASSITVMDNYIIGLNIFQELGDARTVNVSLNNITANQNGFWGVMVETNGAISWVKGEASENGWNGTYAGGGASLTNNSALETASKPIILRDVTFFENLRETGLYISTRGAVNITNVQSLGHTNFVGISVTKNTGLGNILLTNVVSEWNKAGIEISASSIVPRFNNVILTNVTVRNNSYSGLGVTANGNITWNNGGASNNSIGAVTHSAVLDNHSAVSPTTPFWVKVSNVTINNERSWGLSIYSYGGVTLSGVTVTNTRAYGVNIDTCGGGLVNSCTNTYLAPVTVLKSVFNNSTDSIGHAGLYIRASGTVNVSNVQANNNSGRGIIINNRIGTIAAKPVILTNGVFNNNIAGADIQSDGAITLTSITASLNRTWDGVYITNEYAYTPQPVTITGVNNFNANAYNGIYIKSRGVISVSGVRASTNERNGIELFSANSGVKVLNSLVESNKYTGVDIVAAGNVYINNLNCFYNGLSGFNGLRVDARTSPGVPAFVTISNTNVLGNFNIGIVLYVNAPKALNYKLINVAAFGNVLSDIYISE